MAQIQLQPPTPFDFKNPDDWLHWKRQFQQFPGLAKEDQQKQVGTLLYCLGEGAEAVLAVDERKVYETVVTKFDEFFKMLSTNVHGLTVGINSTERRQSST